MTGYRKLELENKCIDIRKILYGLRALKALNLESYTDKLNNYKNSPEFQDILCEGYSAILLLINGFSVSMQESPDLQVRLGNEVFYAEVKHFRYKNQDRIDDENMRCAMKQEQPELVEIGKTPKPAYEQVLEVVVDKINQFKESFANILIIKSDSPNVIDDSIMRNLKHSIQKIHATYPELEKLNGILLLTSDYSITNQRDVYFSRTENPAVPLSQEIHEKLKNLREHRCIKGILHKLIYGDQK